MPETPIKKTLEGQIEQAPTGPSITDLAQIAKFHIAQTLKLGTGKAAQKQAEEQKSIARMLGEIASTRRNEPIQKIIEKLRNKAESIENSFKPGISTGTFDLLNAEIKSLTLTADFLEKQAETNIHHSKGFQAWHETQIQADAQKRAERIQAKHAQEIASSQTISDHIREKISPEKNAIKKERERCIEMVLRDGGSRVFESVEKASRSDGHAGFQMFTDEKLNASNTSMGYVATTTYNLLNEKQKGTLGQSGKVTLEKNHQTEVVGFMYEPDQPEMRWVDVPDVKDIFRRIKKPASRRQEPTGNKRRVTHDQIVIGGKTNERVVWMTYLAEADESQGQEMGFLDYSGRTGQQLQMEIALPESTARIIQDACIKDPALIRKIAESVIKKKLLPNHPERWDNPSKNSTIDDRLSPPYEKWDQAPTGGKIYIQPLGAEPGWHDEFNRKIEKK